MRRAQWSPEAEQAVEPTRIGVKCDPPSVILEYRRGTSRLRQFELHLKPKDLEKVRVS